MNEKLKERIISAAREAMPLMRSLRGDIYAHPEVGGTEEYASAKLTAELESLGYAVERGFGGVPHAFRAELKCSGEGPSAAIFAEYDALPGIGHGCGHNLICSAAVGAAAALAAVKDELPGRVIVYGTPGEENLCTKTTLSAQGCFDEADFAMMTHPNPVTVASGRTRAVEAVQIEFFGRSAHAGTEPERGINALDAATDCYRYIREESGKHPDTNVHGIISSGGEKASVIPDYTCLRYLNRAWDMDTLASLRRMSEDCAARAAAETGCTYRVSNNEETNRPMRTNSALSEAFNGFLTELGEPEILRADSTGSTDMGDVSWRVPAIHPWVGINCPNSALHTVEFAEHTLTTDADVFLGRCSAAMALTAAEVMTDAGLMERIKREFAAPGK